jgi:hypothetical protein
VWISGLEARREGGGTVKSLSGSGDVLKRVCGRAVGHGMGLVSQDSKGGRILFEMVRSLGSECVYLYCACMVGDGRTALGCSTPSFDKKTEFKMYQHMKSNPLLVDEPAPRRQAVEPERIPNRLDSGVV